MAIRMIEYDFYIAMDNKVKNERRYRIEFPRSCVLYLRSDHNTPDYLEVDVVFADEIVYSYQVPAIKMNDYTKDAIFKKNLLLLLPFYIIRYEKDARALSENPDKLKLLLEEYEDIRLRLEECLLEEEKSELYTDLVCLIIKISDYVFRKEETVRKEIGETMGGKVLELESERLIKKGISQGITQGISQGITQGISQGITQGEEKVSILINHLILDNRSDEIKLAVVDKEVREHLYAEYGL